MSRENRDPSNMHYSVDVVMFDSKKKKNPSISEDVQTLEDNIKGKKVLLVVVFVRCR